MSLEHPCWQGRKKRVARRMANDLRLLLPFLGLAGCVGISATAIVAAEDAPIALPFAAAPEIATSTDLSAPAVSAAPPGAPACEPGLAPPGSSAKSYAKDSAQADAVRRAPRPRHIARGEVGVPGSA